MTRLNHVPFGSGPFSPTTRIRLAIGSHAPHYCGVMKCIAILTIVAAGSVLAGEKAVLDKSPVAPPAPTLYSWFAGGTVGYLTENEEEMYTLHLGKEMSYQLGGWSPSVYLEVGYFEIGDCADYEGRMSDVTAFVENPYSEYSEFESLWAQAGRACFDVEVIPVTLNYKLEKPLTNALNVYVGAGAGVAFTEATVDVGPSDDDDDTVFYAQLFAGLLYNVSPTFELYAGARAIYFDEPEYELFGTDFDFDDLGGENTDFLVEAGGRINF